MPEPETALLALPPFAAALPLLPAVNPSPGFIPVDGTGGVPEPGEAPKPEMLLEPGPRPGLPRVGVPLNCSVPIAGETGDIVRDVAAVAFPSPTPIPPPLPILIPIPFPNGVPIPPLLLPVPLPAVVVAEPPKAVRLAIPEDL